ncbi:hypothetical protein C8F01DRAFT_1136995 [Mycena amicta]|nr:hypothetical protein C8F01DRAFT_1136995 [Mycena amicta]
MEKLSEEWTPIGITSTFELSKTPSSDITSQRLAVGKDDIYSALCGFGWRFSVRAQELPKPTVVDSAGESVTSFQITLNFDPNLVRAASFGKLTLRTSVQHLLPSAQTPPPAQVEYNLPASNSYTFLLGTYVYPSNAPTPRLSIAVAFPSSVGLPLPRTLTPKMMSTLEATLDGEELINVKFYAFSRRSESSISGTGTGTRAAFHPLPLFAKSALLRGFSEDLDGLLDGNGFSESNVAIDLDRHVAEDEEIDEAGYGYDSDSDLESDDEIQQPRGKASTESESDGASTVGRRLGRAIVLKGTAFKTWKALLYYLYTGRVRFMALRSESEPASEEPNGPTEPQCSPKSMYRLADKLGLADLQGLAFQSISSRLSENNIIQEVFSSFTSM